MEQECTLTSEQLNGLKLSLTEKLLWLRDNPDNVLEYGEPSFPGGYLSHLRIRFMNTAGGRQFSLKELSAFGIEGSGMYSQDLIEISNAAMSALRRYHRPSKLHLRPSLEMTKQGLSWFIFTEGTQVSCPMPPIPPLPGEVVVELGLPHADSN